MCLGVKLHLCSFFSCSIKLRGLLEYVYAGLWKYVLRLSSDILVNTECKAIFAVASFHKSSGQFCKTCVVF